MAHVLLGFVCLATAVAQHAGTIFAFSDDNCLDYEWSHAFLEADNTCDGSTKLLCSDNRPTTISWCDSGCKSCQDLALDDYVDGSCVDTPTLSFRVYCFKAPVTLPSGARRTPIPEGSDEPELPRGQCCGPSFCHRDLFESDCNLTDAQLASGDYSWLQNHSCADTTCAPKIGGTTTTGIDVAIQTDLVTASTALPLGGKLVVAVTDLGPIETPQGIAVISFTINRYFENGTAIHDFLPANEYILVNLSASGGVVFSEDKPIVVYRVDGAERFDVQIECNEHLDPDVAFKFVSPVWQIPICHTSDFVLAFSNTSNSTNSTDDCDGDDHDDDDCHDTKPTKKAVTKKEKPKKEQAGKPTKAAKPAKAGKPTKAKAGDGKDAPAKTKDAKGAPTKKVGQKSTPKPKTKEVGKSGKGKIAVGAGVGAGVGAAGALVVCLLRRRANASQKGKKRHGWKREATVARTLLI